MNICVFGAASAKIEEKYVKATEGLCFSLAKCGHDLVYGAGATGLMGAAARGFKRGGGKVHGVIPEFFREESIEQIYTDCDELTFTQTMSERKRTMEDIADAFIVVPGGVGTFEEFFEVLTLKQLGRHKKAIAVYSIDGYYDGLELFLKEASERRFILFECDAMYSVFNDGEDVKRYIQTYIPHAEPEAKNKSGV